MMIDDVEPNLFPPEKGVESREATRAASEAASPRRTFAIRGTPKRRF